MIYLLKTLKKQKTIKKIWKLYRARTLYNMDSTINFGNRCFTIGDNLFLSGPLTKALPTRQRLDY